MSSNDEKWYIVHAHTHFQDGHEYSTKMVQGITVALQVADKWGAGLWSRENTDVRIFEVGKEIPLEVAKEEEPQPAVVKVRHKVKGRKGK